MCPQNTSCRAVAIWLSFPPPFLQPARQLWNPSERIGSASFLARRLPPSPSQKKNFHPVLSVPKPSRGCLGGCMPSPEPAVKSFRFMAGREILLVASGLISNTGSAPGLAWGHIPHPESGKCQPEAGESSWLERRDLGTGQQRCGSKAKLFRGRSGCEFKLSV